MPLPPLAGLATYERAAQLGLDVERNVRRLLRAAWFEKRTMEVALYWLASTPEWELKEVLGLHARLDAEHVARLRERIGEMRSPAPRMDVSPDERIDAFFGELLSAGTSFEKIVGFFGVLRPALHAAFQSHLEETNPLIDHPTNYLMQHLLLDQGGMADYARRAVEATVITPEECERAEAWQSHLHAYLAAAGGVSGEDTVRGELPPTRVTAPFVPDYFPVRDERFTQRWNFTNPQRQVSMNEAVPLDERTLALMCRRIVEMDVPEYMSRIVGETKGEPWEFYVDMTRQLWDEVRHSMLGTIYFEARGVDWKSAIAIHAGMSIRLHSLGVTEAHNVLYSIEQNLMPANTGKRLEYEISANAGDKLAAQIQDYDWADEVLHVYIGRRRLLPKLDVKGAEAVRQGWDLRVKTAHILDDYASGEQKNWWPELVKTALGRETAMTSFDLSRL